MQPVRGLVGRVRGRVAEDLRADPYLGYVLLLSVLLCGFWLWHGLPNFATRDERWRILAPIEPVGFVVADPSVESFREGVLHWREYGATTYIYGLALVPVVAAVLLAGRGDVFTHVAFHHYSVGLWEQWTGAPAWFWTTVLLVGRVVTLLFAVGSVYLTYRIGTTMRDRATGRLAAMLLTLTWGFSVLSHEVGEDVPALFFLLLTFYLALRYVETGDPRPFYWGCLAGGFAIAVKLTAGIAVIMLGTAVVLRARRADGPFRSALVRPRLLAAGALLGMAGIVFGYPGALVGGPQVLAERIGGELSKKGDPHGWLRQPSWWWILRGFLHGYGLPLFVAVVAGVLASVRGRRERPLERDGVTIALAGAGAALLVYARWSYVRTHHLLPVFALLAVVAAATLARFVASRPSVGRPVVALLLVTSALYAGVGAAGYATQPRDRAAGWLADRTTDDATIETYVIDPQEAGVPHGPEIYHPRNRTMTVDGEVVTLGWGTWIRAMPERCPDYVQVSYHGGLHFVAPGSYSMRAARLSNPYMATYFEDLLAEDRYPYRVAATFGPRPRFLDDRGRRDPWWRLLRAGLVPRTIQYGDPQDMGVDQYTVVLERTGPCDPEANSPLS